MASTKMATGDARVVKQSETQLDTGAFFLEWHLTAIIPILS